MPDAPWNPEPVAKRVAMLMEARYIIETYANDLKYNYNPDLTPDPEFVDRVEKWLSAWEITGSPEPPRIDLTTPGLL